MVKNYIKIAYRNLIRFKFYTFINLLGLALGLTVGILILIYIIDETGYDKFQSNGDRIYKVMTHNSEGMVMETCAWPVGQKLKEDYPEVEAVVYARKGSSTLMLTHEGKRYSHNLHFVSAPFFEIFTFPLLEGNANSALYKPFSIVITETVKQRYFGNQLALGKTLLLRDTLEFTITGVVADVPEQSHIQFEMLASFASLETLEGFSYTDGWGNFNVRNYIMLNEKAAISDLQQKAAGMYMDSKNEGDRFRELGMNISVQFLPFSDIYLKSEAHNGFGPKGSLERIYLVSAIAIFVLLLACINFINLTTARSVYRAKEVGIRKIVGSTRKALLWQFMSESFLLTIAAAFIGAILIDFALPFFNQLMGKNYDLGILFQPLTLMAALTLAFLVSILAGYYPAWVLSGYKSIEVLKGRMQSSAKGVKLRQSLVVFQFFISSGLVLATLVVLNQLDYMRNQQLGFAKEQILVLDATRVTGNAPHEAFKNELKKLNGIEEVSFTNALPGRPGWDGQWAYPEVIKEENLVITEYMAVDENYLHALGLELIAGRNFDLNNAAELDEGVVINETTVKAMGWQTPENAIGKRIVSPSRHPEGTVIGVVKDYHGQGLQNKIMPKVMDFNSTAYGRYYAVRFNTANISEILKNTELLWSKMLGDFAFEYSFLDQDFDKQYQSEERLMAVFVIFAVLTVIIASIGLLGLVSFMVVSRTKEIGIRKVLGANVMAITGLLTKEFVVLVVIANIIAIPMVWYFGESWLANFAYHGAINPIIFIVTMVVTVAMALITVGLQTFKAATQNPIETLRNE